MAATKFTSALPLASETAGEAEARAAREEAIIAKAEADIDAGLGVDDADVESWLDALDCNPDAPIPGGRSGLAFR